MKLWVRRVLVNDSSSRVVVCVKGSQSSAFSRCVVCGSRLDRENRSEILNVCYRCWRVLVK